MDKPRTEARLPRDTDLTNERLTPEDDIELMDHRVKMAARDEEKTCFDPTEPPKPPHPKEEPVTSLDGSAVVDIQRDTSLVDDLADFDLSLDDLCDCEPL